MQSHQSFNIAQHQEALLGEGVMASLSEVLGAHFDLRLVLRFVEVLAHFHDRVEDASLPVNLNGILILLRLAEQFSGFLPLPSVSEVLSLLDEDDWVALIAVLFDQFIGFREFLKRCI